MVSLDWSGERVHRIDEEEVLLRLRETQHPQQFYTQSACFSWPDHPRKVNLALSVGKFDNLNTFHARIWHLSVYVEQRPDIDTCIRSRHCSEDIDEHTRTERFSAPVSCGRPVHHEEARDSGDTDNLLTFWQSVQRCPRSASFVPRTSGFGLFRINHLSVLSGGGGHRAVFASCVLALNFRVKTAAIEIAASIFCCVLLRGVAGVMMLVGLSPTGAYGSISPIVHA